MSENDRIIKLIYQLRNGSAQERSSAIVDLEQLGAKEAVPALLENVKFSDAGVRANVAVALAVLGDRNAGPALLALLQDPDALVRLNAAESMGNVHYKEGADALADRLKMDCDPLVRVHAAEALGRIGGSVAINSLAAALSDRDEGVRAYSADSLGRLGDVRAVPFLTQRLAVEQSIFTKAFLLSAQYRLNVTEALESLILLSEKADDTLAITILNLALELASADNKEKLIKLIRESGRARTELRVEIDSILKRLSGM